MEQESWLFANRVTNLSYAGIPSIPVVHITLLRAWNDITRKVIEGEDGEPESAEATCNAIAGMRLETITENVPTVVEGKEVLENKVMKTEEKNIPFIYDPEAGCINKQAFAAIMAHLNSPTT